MSIAEEFRQRTKIKFFKPREAAAQLKGLDTELRQAMEMTEAALGEEGLRRYGLKPDTVFREIDQVTALIHGLNRLDEDPLLDWQNETIAGLTRKEASALARGNHVIERTALLLPRLLHILDQVHPAEMALHKNYSFYVDVLEHWPNRFGMADLSRLAPYLPASLTPAEEAAARFIESVKTCYTKQAPLLEGLAGYARGLTAVEKVVNPAALQQLAETVTLMGDIAEGRLDPADIAADLPAIRKRITSIPSQLENLQFAVGIHKKDLSRLWSDAGLGSANSEVPQRGRS
jgi:hypothetical protein